jgi:S-formylglutathione hydrolase
LSNLEQVESHHCFGGVQAVFRHPSAETKTPMRFSIYLPPQEGPRPVLWWLSGLTCTEENFTAKAGAQRYAAELGMILVAPDTSPRGEGVPDDSDGAYDFGLGAGFYVDATQAPWSAHYRMYSYVTRELPELVAREFPVDMGRQAISGHSMGGHGALTLGLRHPDRYRSISAFSPIVAPSRVPWGQKALGGYLGGDERTWLAHDAVALIKGGARASALLVDVGTNDPFLDKELKPELLEAACAEAGVPLTLRRQEGYDHSYYFVSTFIGDHLRWHAERLA